MKKEKATFENLGLSAGSESCFNTHHTQRLTKYKQDDGLK